MATANSDAEGEAWEMRLRTVAAEPRKASKLRQLLGALRGALTVVGYEGMPEVFLDN